MSSVVPELSELSADRGQTVLLTGFPRLLIRGLTRRALKAASDNRVFLLVDPRDHEAAERFVSSLDAEAQARVELLQGHLRSVDMGLSGQVARQLLEQTTLVFHASARQSGTRAQMRSNLLELSGLLGFAKEMTALTRFCLFSSAFVSGSASGTIHAEALDMGQRLRTPFERSMFECEQLARAMMPTLPITVLRPSAMLGHSRTGESQGLTEGPNYLVKLMVRLPAEVPFLLPGTGVVPFNIVPIDYVVRAAWVLAIAPEAQSRVFHLTDPNPVSARQAFALLGDLANRPAPFAGRWANGVLRRLARLSGLGIIAPAQLALLEDLTTHVIYDCSGTLELLAGTEVRCPPFESYADTLVSWVAQYEQKSQSGRSGRPR